MKDMSIKQGVSLYSYQQAYFKKEIDLEGAVKAAAAAGATGIELIPEQMPVGRYPNPTDRDIAWWKELMTKYGTTPTCMDAFMDSRMYKGRYLTLPEQVNLMERDLKLASQLGFFCIRVLCHVRPEVVEAALPIAEYYGVKMGLEVHAPLTLTGEWVSNYVEMVERKGSPYAALIPDFGIFGRGMNGAMQKAAILKGADPVLLDKANQIIKAGGNVAPVIEEFKRQGAGSDTIMVIQMTSMMNRYNNPEWLRPLAKHLCHFHAKFYLMDENYQESSIDYAGPVKVLKEVGFDGYLSSEFEGQRSYQAQDCAYEEDEIEQVRRHHVMLNRLIVS
jgi:sugar phosphate isomerase/epimerase